MTESDEIEEILMEASAHNLRREVMDWAKAALETNPKLNKAEAYQMGYNEWCK